MNQKNAELQEKYCQDEGVIFLLKKKETLAKALGAGPSAEELQSEKKDMLKQLRELQQDNEHLQNLANDLLNQVCCKDIKYKELLERKDDLLGRANQSEENFSLQSELDK